MSNRETFFFLGWGGRHPRRKQKIAAMDLWVRKHQKSTPAEYRFHISKLGVCVFLSFLRLLLVKMILVRNNGKASFENWNLFKFGELKLIGDLINSYWKSFYVYMANSRFIKTCTFILANFFKKKKFAPFMFQSFLTCEIPFSLLTSKGKCMLHI